MQLLHDTITTSNCNFNNLGKQGISMHFLKKFGQFPTIIKEEITRSQ